MSRNMTWGDVAASSLSCWLRGIADGTGYLRERQWLRPSGGGELLVMPPCFRHDGEALENEKNRQGHELRCQVVTPRG